MSRNHKQTIIPPEGGWKENSVYLVEVAYRETNPAHRAMFYTGFLHDGRPAGYNSVIQPSSQVNNGASIGEVRFLRAVKLIAASEEFKCPTKMAVDVEAELGINHDD